MGRRAQLWWKRLSPDIVVTDVKMPRMDGVEMIAKLRENGCQAKFIILTAYSDFQVCPERASPWCQ